MVDLDTLMYAKAVPPNIISGIEWIIDMNWIKTVKSHRRVAIKRSKQKAKDMLKQRSNQIKASLTLNPFLSSYKLHFLELIYAFDADQTHSYKNRS